MMRVAACCHLVSIVSLVKPGQELFLRQTKLSQEEHSVTDKIGEAARVSPATDAALASCSEKVRVRTMERTSRHHCDD